MSSNCKTIGCGVPARPGKDYCLACFRSQETQTGNLNDINPEYTGGSVSYYQVPVKNPFSGGPGYDAECGDIIEALGMDFNEGNAFKAIWRKCAARSLNLKKKGYKDGVYDSEKVVYFGERMVAAALRSQDRSDTE